MTTTPNYSLFLDRPRWDDLHSMMRIAIVHSEFLAEGMPAALHVNGRTDHDFDRWAHFVRSRDGITHVAYEFTTGTAVAGRRMQHVTWLIRMARAVRRPLHLIVRGGADLLPLLRGGFASVTFLDTSVFIKTMMRQQAHLRDDGRTEWQQKTTALGEPLDELFASNWSVRGKFVAGLVRSAQAG
jgi:hypothetical protein